MALVYATGVVENGARRGAGVPSNPRHALRVVQSESLTIRLAVLYADGSRFVFTPGYYTVLTVRRNLNGVLLFQEKQGVLQPQLGQNVVDFTVAVADTDPTRTQSGQYAYDIWLTSPAGARDALVPTSPFILEPAIGRA